MSEGTSTPPKTKRSSAKTFKNPPQPHMCIQDSRKAMDCNLPCYINVLSWDKVDMPANPNQQLPLYGGMKLNPPRTEDKSVSVFAVIANPEVLRLRGKNSKDLTDQSSLIEVLLDFVESMNDNIKFTRRYTIMKDRDIVGELKDVWSAVQNLQKDRENLSNQQETCIDAHPSVPQYPSIDQQQQQQQHQLQQQQHMQQYQQLHPQLQAPPPLQQIPPQVQQMQQNQQIIQNSYMMSQPPQYQPSLVFNPGTSNEGSNYDRYNYQQPNPVSVNQSDQACQTNSVTVNQNDQACQTKLGVPNYNGNNYTNKLDRPDRFNSNRVKNGGRPHRVPKYQFQQLPRQMEPQYINSNLYQNFNPQPIPQSGMVPQYKDYQMMQHQDMTLVMNQRQMENQILSEVHRMQQQQHHHHQQLQQHQQHQQQLQQEQMHVLPIHMQQEQSLQYQLFNLNNSIKAQMGSKRGYPKCGPQHLGGMQKNNNGKRQNYSPPPLKQGLPSVSSTTTTQPKENIENLTKPKSPVKVLQRDCTVQNKQNISQSSLEKNPQIPERNMSENNKTYNVQVIPVDEDEMAKKLSEASNEAIKKLKAIEAYAAALEELNELRDNSRESKTPIVENPTSTSSDTRVQESQEVKHTHHFNQKQRSIKIVLEKSCSSDVKAWNKHANKGFKNGMRNNTKQTNQNSVQSWLQEKDVDENLKGHQSMTDVNSSTGWNVNVKHKQSDSPKRTQSTVNSLIKSVFKIHHGNNTVGDDTSTGKKQKANGQVKGNVKLVGSEQEESNQGYTILKKSEETTVAVSTSDELANEIAQLAIQDCKDTSEVNAVLS